MPRSRYLHSHPRNYVWYRVIRDGISSFGGLFNSTFRSVDFSSSHVISLTVCRFGLVIAIRNTAVLRQLTATLYIRFCDLQLRCCYDAPWDCLGGLESRQAWYNTDLTMWLSIRRQMVVLAAVCDRAVLCLRRDKATSSQRLSMINNCTNHLICSIPSVVKRDKATLTSCLTRLTVT